ncbi:MAG: MMPL family transporter [Myxococcaceae bacterium]
MIERIEARPKLAALILFLVCGLPLFLTVQFFGDVRAGMTELLPQKAPARLALEELHDRLGAQSRLIVIAQGEDGDANRRFIKELGQRLEAAKLPEVKLIQIGCFEDCQWVRDHVLLLLDDKRFESMLGQAEAGVKHAKAEANPLYVDIEDDGSAPKEDPWKKLQQDIDEQSAANDRFPNGYFELPGGKRVVMLISLQGSETEFDPSKNLFDGTVKEVEAIRSKYPKEMVVAYNGEVANMVEEHAAILADLSLSSLLVFFLVGGVILFYFRSIRGLLAVLFALTPGLLFTFAIGRLTVHHLNSNTAFLGSIIAGNGINYPLLVLAYYRAQNPNEPRAESIRKGLKGSFFGTLAASLTASAAYAGLAISTFKGFSQFGWIGGVGMVTCWVFTMISMPVAIALFNPPREVTESPTRKWLNAFFARKTAPVAVALGFAAVSLIGAALGVVYASKNGLYAMDLRVLRNRDSLSKGSASWDPKVSEVFGVWLNPVAGMVEHPEERETYASALKATMVEGPAHVAERVQTLEQFAPPVAKQEKRIERLKKFRASLEHVPKEKIPERARPYLDTWLSDASLVPVTVKDVPNALIAPFKEVNGDPTKTVLLFPSLKINYNDARNILKFVDELDTVKAPKDSVVGGGFMFMAEIIRLVQSEAPKIIGVVALLVALVLLPMLFRKPARVLLVVGSVGTVAILAQANMLAVGVQLNMLDFAAVPITIGVGSDYLVNLLGAMDAFKVDARRACARMGGAIFLCSLTTVIGYASLLVAQSGALRTFGWAAVFGEIMAVSTVLLVIPALWAPAEPKQS